MIYSFLREECGLVAETSKLMGLLATVRECGWWIPCRDTVFVSSRPSKIDLAQYHKSVYYADGLECRR